MSNSLILKKTCPKCNLAVTEASRLALGLTRLVKLSCGHLIPEKDFTFKNDAVYSKPFQDSRTLMPFQIDAVKFAEKSNFRCLIADEQGLGKTLESLATVKFHLDTLTPCLAVTKTTIKQQWLYEIFGVTGSQKIQVLKTSKDKALPGFDFYVITYDILKESSVFDYIEIKSLILDECQAIKNHLSGRAKAVQKIVELHKIEHIIGLSGTPIKNNAGEYFTILNLLRPERFPSYDRYLRTYCDSYETAYGYKVGGLSDMESFQEATKDFIIRRTQSEVLPDLMALRQPRKFHHVELNKKLNAAYGQAVKELEELFYADEDENTMTSMIAVMTKMRQITGVSKTDEAVDYITDFLMSTDRRICVFVHHHVVADLLEKKLNSWLESGGYASAVMYRAGDDRDSVISQFERGKVLIASTLASGEGMDGLQKLCSDMIILERQWNPANEEQVEGRLGRIGQTKPVNYIYMIAAETIDDYFTELVERKRAIVSQTLDGQMVNWETNDLMRELAQLIVTKGLKRFTL